MEADPFIFWMIAVFAIGYLLITLEHFVDVNKATTAILMGVVLWVLEFALKGIPKEEKIISLDAHISNISQVFFFLLGALIIVEIINSHQGFKVFSSKMFIQSKRLLLWAVCILAFFLSSILDNLTTTIVMISILQKIISDPKERLIMCGGVVIAANAGGVWTPIGDVTTTMLWIGDRLSTFRMMVDLFLPSITCLIVSLICLTPTLKGNLPKKILTAEESKIEPISIVMLIMGLGVLVSVPIFKYFTGLPPFMGIIFGMSILWLFTDFLHGKKEGREHLRMANMLYKVDISGPLFFLGILLAVNALDSAGILGSLANMINDRISNPAIIASTIGLASAIVDNIPLVLATMGMYELTEYAMDSNFWQLIAYCAGTGGSILIVGSAAGVVMMGMEKVNFFSYVRRITLPAAAGYFAGIVVYLLLK